MSRRNPATLGVWGDNGTRTIASENYWKQPQRWNSWARDGVCLECKGKSGIVATGVVELACPECGGTGRIEPYRARVFCASLADVFEDRPELVAPRQRLFDLIVRTTHLDWLLLTKRPQNVAAMVPPVWFEDWPSFVWLGTSVEDQDQADKRIPALLNVPATVRFLSLEPLLGPVDLRRVADGEGFHFNSLSRKHGIGLTTNFKGHDQPNEATAISLCIVGGESGPGARQFDIEWARAIRDQCKAAGVPFFLKQLGANAIGKITSASPVPVSLNKDRWILDRKGGDWNEWPEDLRIREMPKI